MTTMHESYLDPSILALFTPDIPVVSSKSNSTSSSPSASTSTASPIPVASTSSASSGGNEPVIGTETKRIKNCGPCRIRRVKCERIPGSDASQSCKKCADKNIQCTPLPPKQGKKTLKRSGPRLELAKSFYGEATPTVTSTTLAVQVNPLGPLTNTSTKLNTAEIEGIVMLSLLDEFFADTILEPIVGVTRLPQAFHLANRRIAELDEQSQVLCAAIVAHVSRTTSNPLIVGAGAPSKAQRSQLFRSSLRNRGSLDIQSASTLGAAENLGGFGRRREDACKRLLDRAVGLSDKMGTFRKVPTLESVSSLVLLEGLVAYYDQANPLDPMSRPYAQAYTGHVKYLLEEGKPEQKVAGTFLGYVCLLRQGLVSAETGRANVFSEDDYFLLSNGCTAPSLSLVAQQPIDSSRPPMERYHTILKSFMSHLASTVMDAPKRLTGRQARLAPLDIQYVRLFLTRIQCARLNTPAFIASAKAHANAPDHTQRPKGPIWRHMRALRLGVCLHSFLLWRCVRERSDDRRVKEVEKDVWEAAFDAAREVVKLIEESFEDGETVENAGWTDAKGSELLFSRLPLWASLLVDTTIAEDGGPSDFTLDTKLSNLITLQQALYSLSWSYPSYTEQSVPWINAEIEKLERRERDQWIDSGFGGGFGTTFSDVTGEIQGGLWTDGEMELMLYQSGLGLEDEFFL